MYTITLEEHFLTQDFLRATGLGEGGSLPMQLPAAELLDLGEGRLRAMDEAGVDLQVLSLAALGLNKLKAEDEVAVLRGVHDEVAAAVKANPGRFRALATPPLNDPEAAAKELQRCVEQLGFVGVMFDGTVDGEFLDSPRFFPVLEAAQALGVPVYVHPAPPPLQVAEIYYSHLPEEVGYLLSIAGWGWHIETGLHALRLIVSGVLDRLPRLKVIIGHMGEGLPYALARSSAVLSRASKRERTVAETFREQFWITTSGYFTRPPFECAREVMGLERMMYSVDYPFSRNTQGEGFVRSLELSEAEERALRGETAAALLRLPLPERSPADS